MVTELRRAGMSRATASVVGERRDSGERGEGGGTGEAEAAEAEGPWGVPGSFREHEDVEGSSEVAWVCEALELAPP